MADELKTILIKDLQEAESAADTDYIAIDNGTVTKKIRVDNYNKTANGTAKSYAESAKESADKAQRNADSVSSTVTEITNNITAAQSAAIQAEKSAEAAESATSNLQTYVNAAKESADNAKASEESTKNVADKIADSNKIAQSYAVGGTNYRIGEDTDNARYYYSGAKTAEANSETYKSNAAASESAAATSEINAKTSETNAAKSAASASSSAESATTSKDAAAMSEQNASNSANYARANATRAESYAIGGTSSRSGEDTDNAKYYAQQAKKSAETAAGSITGVSSFNGRTGTIMPENGDYKAEQITYDNSASGVSANTVQSAIDKVAESDAKKAIKADVDSALNLKANKADVSSSLSGKQDNLGIKSIGSNLTLSNGVLDAKKQLTVDTALSTTSTNPVQNKAVAAAINANTSKIAANTSAIATKSDSNVTDQLAKNTAQIETAGTATNAHSVGEYVMISNALYKVTASVAKGDTWTIGTNVTATNVGSEIGSLKSDLANKLYPVGSIYMSVNATNPAALFGGTWEQIKDRFLLAAGDTYAAGATGGEATHTLTTDEMPSHTHSPLIFGNNDALGINNGGYGTVRLNCESGASSSNISTAATGGSQPHNNMPPYLAVYMWKRTA